MDFPFKTPPFKHQLESFEKHRFDEIHARFWEQGCAKSKPTIDEAAALYREGLVRGLCVVAPVDVHRNWITDELPAHLIDEVAEGSASHVFYTGKMHTQKHKRAIREAFENKGFSTIAFTYESLKTEVGWHTFQYWMRNRPSLLVADESRRMKTPGSQIGKRMMAVGRRAKYKRILDGTPVPNGPFDIYNQMKFLNDDFWRPYNLDNFAAFKAYFGVFKPGQVRLAGGKLHEYDHLVGYRNLEHLHEILDKHGSRYLKDDVLDLPPKLYSKRYFDMTPKQAQVYENLRDEFMHEWEDGRILTADMAIVRLLRLHQVTRGYVPVERGEPATEIEGGNPCQKLLASICDELPHQAIIWCRFDKDVELALAHLKEKAVRFDGKVNELERERNKRAFKAGEKQFFVAKPVSGLTLNEAKTEIFVSNDFDYDKRLQAEDRAHRPGQNDRVHIIDLISRFPGNDQQTTIDDYQLANLRKKNVVSAKILGDPLKEWI
jgi:SNF2 family DNA or RNA helicase